MKQMTSLSQVALASRAAAVFARAWWTTASIGIWRNPKKTVKISETARSVHTITRLAIAFACTTVFTFAWFTVASSATSTFADWNSESVNETKGNRRINIPVHWHDLGIVACWVVFIETKSWSKKYVMKQWYNWCVFIRKRLVHTPSHSRGESTKGSVELHPCQCHDVCLSLSTPLDSLRTQLTTIISDKIHHRIFRKIFSDWESWCVLSIRMFFSTFGGKEIHYSAFNEKCHHLHRRKDSIHKALYRWWRKGGLHVRTKIDLTSREREKDFRWMFK